MYFSTYIWSTWLLGNKEYLAFNVISVPVQSNDADGITSLSAGGLSCFQIKIYTRYNIEILYQSILPDPLKLIGIYNE